MDACSQTLMNNLNGICTLVPLKLKQSSHSLAVIFLAPYSSSSMMNMFWSFFVASLAKPGVPDYVLRVYSSKFFPLPWQSFLPTLHNMELMQEVCFIFIAFWRVPTKKLYDRLIELLVRLATIFREKWEQFREEWSTKKFWTWCNLHCGFDRSTTQDRITSDGLKNSSFIFVPNNFARSFDCWHCSWNVFQERMHTNILNYFLNTISVPIDLRHLCFYSLLLVVWRLQEKFWVSWARISSHGVE